MKRVLLITTLLLLSVITFAQTKKITFKTCEIEYGTFLNDVWVMDGEKIPFTTTFIMTSDLFVERTGDYTSEYNVIKKETINLDGDDVEMSILDDKGYPYTVKFTSSENMIAFYYSDGDNPRVTKFNLNTVKRK